MASIDINIGTAADSGNGDNLRAFATNVAAMFAEIYGLGTAESDLATGTAFRPALSLIADQAANTVVVRDANSSGTLSAKAVADTQLLIGDGAGFTAAALSGDVTMTNAGGVTIKTNVALAGSPTTTTQSASDNSTKIATTAYTDTAIANLVDSSPSALNTLNELAAALGDDASFATTMTNALAAKQATITGAATTIDTEDLTASRALVSNASGKVEVSAVTSTEVGYLDGVTSAIQTQLDAKIGTGAGAVGSSNIAANAATPAKVSLFDDNTVATDTHILIADGTDFINKAVSGDITIANTGAVTIANGAVENAMLADDAVGADELASNAVVTASIVDDNVTHDKLEGRYTSRLAIATQSGTISIDWGSHSVFKFSNSLNGTTTLDYTGYKNGQCIEICGLTGSQTINITDQGTGTSYHYQVSADYDSSKSNLLQVTCLNDDGTSPEFAYVLSNYTDDATDIGA